jgi:SAM-dependent methyltransferase
MSEQFWENRWIENKIGWDLGQVSPPIEEYVNQLTDKTISILIPGCGNAYEAEFLISTGFTKVYIVEISISAISSFKKRCPDFPNNHIIHSNFFDIEGQYDLILEQTFFCALDPYYRNNYVEQMTKLLKSDGKLIGLLFNTYFSAGPPFGGDVNLYESLFSDAFKIDIMETAYNSIEPRKGSELFIKMIK